MNMESTQEETSLPKIVLSNFSKTYGFGKKKVLACSGISVTFCRGSITGLLGPNGAGKTTILKALCGMHYGDEGTLSLVTGSGTTEDIDEIRRCTGFVPETPMLDKNLTVKETLFASAAAYGLTKKDALDTVSESIELCSLEHVLFQKVGTLSKGYAQRTSVAKALAHNPKIVILDEYSGGLDPAQIVQMREVIQNLSKTKAIIFSTHHIDEALALCKNVYIIANGKIVSSGTIGDVIASTKSTSLEDAFLALTKQSSEGLK